MSQLNSFVDPAMFVLSCSCFHLVRITLPIYLLPLAVLFPEVIRAGQANSIETNPVDVMVLYDLYQACNGDAWKWDNASLARGQPWSFNASSIVDSNPCSNNWIGVSCSCRNHSQFDVNAYGYYGQYYFNYYDTDDFDNHYVPTLCAIQKLFLVNMNLNGRLPATVSNLKNLTHLHLGRNYFLTGTIPSSIEQLHHLEVLSLPLTGINGFIPTTIGLLLNLTNLNLAYSKVSGLIPTEIGMLTNLILLGLSGTRISGSLISEIGNLQSLLMLEASNNLLSSSLPTTIGRLTALLALDIFANFITGSIPTEIGTMSSLAG